MTEWRVQVGDDEVSATLDEAMDGESRGVFVCAHGAGGNKSDRGMLSAASTLRRRGLDVVRFNFPYTEKKSHRPDRMPLLQDSVSAVVAHTRQQLRPSKLFIGGRSMGGRAASMLAAEGFAADGLILLAYPLHPAGRPEQLRAAHLSQITMPVLALSGTRDALCTRELMEKALRDVPAPWEMHWIEGADHSFHVLKRSGRTDADVLKEIGDTTERWLTELNAR
ncbi:MAG TPA: alpha/beta family hydrolase [Gemmatimonadaceae bacterium]|nr:alpha/beta family hydrolase [Gemmatimonadaceae bacterium]